MNELNILSGFRVASSNSLSAVGGGRHGQSPLLQLRFLPAWFSLITLRMRVLKLL